MSDISIPWSVILWMAPILMPFLSIPGALFAGFGWYRRKRNFYAALVAAVAGAFVPPWLVLIVIATVEKLSSSGHLTRLGKGALWCVAALAIVGVVVAGVSHAGSRRRGGS